MDSAPCPDHPTRVTTDTCVRCGRFLCDWCILTAPDWAPRSCAPCQQIVFKAAPPPIRLQVGILIVLVAMSGVVEIAQIVSGLRWLRKLTPDSGVNPLTLRVEFLISGVLAALAAICVVEAIRRRRRTIPLMTLMLSLELALVLAFWIPAVVTSPELPALADGAGPFLLRLALLIYVRRSRQVRETFVR
jgi:hypothetical protein